MLSVVITTYKRPEGLDRTLMSLSKQTRMPDEIIVSDNASPDNTAEIAEKWRSCFNNFKYIKNPENIGMPGNLNNAIKATSGDLVINLHDADHYYPTLLEKTEAVMLQNPNVGLVFWPCSEWAHVDRGIGEITNGREFFLKHYYRQTSSKIWGTAMVRKAAYDELLPFDNRFKAWADVDMWMRICLDWDIAYIPDALVDLYVEEGQFRKWYWEKSLLIQKMFFVNVCRHFGDDKKAKSDALAAQLSVQKKLWWRFFLARIKHRQWRLLAKSLSFYSQYNQLPDMLELREKV